MLEGLRKWASGWVAFILIFFLILSFAIWGVADVFTGGQYGELANVGDETISEVEFQRAMQNEISQISQRAGRRITMEQARAFGLDRQVLSRLIGAGAVQAHAKELDLALSDAAIADGFRRDPNFQGVDGAFSRPLLESVMRQMGVSEQGLIELRRKDEMREHITTALLRSAVVPDAMIDTLHEYREEKRVISHFTIDADKVVSLKDPSDEDLKKTYEANKAQFMTPQRRSFTALVLTQDAVKAKAPITDDEIKVAYTQTKSKYDKPEKRVIQQIAFKDMAAAQKAKADIDGGKDFMDVAKDNGATEKDITLGVKTKSELIDPKIADAAFALEGGKVSAPVEGRFTTVLLRVTNVVSGEESTLDSARALVREELANEWAADHIRTVFDQVDDGRAAARPLNEIAEELGLKHFDIKDVDSRNQKEDKSLALDVVDSDRIIASAFGAEVGVEQEPVELAAGGFAWLDLNNVVEPKQLTFDDVKADVKALWTTNTKRAEISKAATAFVKRLNNGAAIAKVAEDAGGKVVTSDPTTRARIPDGMTQAALSQAFVLPEGEAGSSETTGGQSRLVFKVDDIQKAVEPTDEQKTVLKNELVGQLRQDQISVYLAKLQDRLGVDINQRVLDRVTGVTPALGHSY
ncbi:MAG: peptidylprolyl isomerase [Pseudomonadota bacterium]